MNKDYSSPRRLTRPPPSTSNLSRNSSNVSWGTKIKGAIQVGHGLGDAIRGSLGASDIGPHAYTSSGEIAERGRHEIAQGLARIRGVTTQLPPAPVYDRRHSYPTQQYEQPTSMWGRRSSSAHHSQRRENPPTASSPFEKYYEHPYPAQQEQDSGFAGLGAGIDPARRKEGNDRIVPAFLVHPPPPPTASETPYASQTRYPAHSASPRMSLYQDPSMLQPSGIPSIQSSTGSTHDSIAPSQPPRIPAQSSSVGPYYEPINNAHLSMPSPIYPADFSSIDPPISDSAQSTGRRGFLTKTIRSTGKGKEKEHNKLRRGRIQSMFGRHSATRPSSPDHDVTEPVDLLDPSTRESHAPHQTRSAPATPPPHRHEAVLEHGGYEVLSYNAKDAYPHWPTEEERRAQLQAGRSRRRGARLEPVRSVRA
ncbi:hypothetical protein MVEN_02581500 [Mycena venus]|uniref:Uncharacterized protein n=1 Tax=Mycena venus TaxID=2733690 RepID=A0A8H6U1V6_9AGAR|nr:hypothetical protein MVEN_02581500 [Mycena venus]